MNKVICDVCGTMYPDNAEQCPICGSPKTADAQPVQADGAQVEGAAGAYGYTKGGHFSKSNVRKRGKATKTAPKAAVEDDALEEEDSNGSNKGLIIAIVLLIIAIVGMLCYIFFTYFAGDLFGEAEPATTVSTTAATTPSSTTMIKCNDLDLQVPNNEIILEKVDHAWLLRVAPTPSDTTEEITFTTSDPSVAMVSSDGRVTAVGNGTAIITVTCGDVVKECKVVCNIDTDPDEDPVPETTETTEATEPTEATEATEPTTKPTEPKPDLTKFYLFPRRDGDCTIDVDESFTLQLRDGNGKKVDVTWTATVEGYFSIDGDVITGVKPTPIDPNEAHDIRAVCTYEGVEFSCIIRVRHPVSTEPVLPPETTEYTGPTIADPGYKISHTDVTIGGSEPISFVLTLNDSNGQPVDVTWESSKPGIVTINGNTISCKTKGWTVVSCRVSNWVYECKVYVKTTVQDSGAVG